MSKEAPSVLPVRESKIGLSLVLGFPCFHRDMELNYIHLLVWGLCVYLFIYLLSHSWTTIINMLIFSLLREEDIDVFLLSNLSMKGLRPALQIKTWGWKAGCELATFTHSPGSQLCSGLHQGKYGLQVEGGDSLPLPHPQGIPPVVPLPSLESSTSPQHGTVGLDPGSQKWSVWNTSPKETGWKICGCPSWRRKGSRELLEQPFGT